jgi:predicted HD superfamily hydrolase involved in NAD metabolism
MKVVDEWETRLRARLSAKRFRHCRNVAELAVRIARAHGIDPERARIAGLFHDAGKELPENEKKALLHRKKPQGPDDLRDYPALWHAYAGAVLAEEEFGIDDAEILHIIRFHPTGHETFGPLGHTLFVSDYCEPYQKNPHHKELTELAIRDLEAAVIRVIRLKIEYLFHKKRTIHPAIVGYWNKMMTSKKEQTL